MKKNTNTSEPIRILCIDPDSGFGGSSTSLYLSILNMNREGVIIEIWFACDSPMRQLYNQIGIESKIVPSIVKFRSLRRFSRNVYTFLQFLLIFLKNITTYRNMALIIQERFDLVHFNQEGSFLIAFFLRKNIKNVPFIFHVRTLLPKNWVTKLQVKVISLIANFVIFISENERDRFYWANLSVDNYVLYNVASIPKLQNIQIHQKLKNNKRLKVLSLSNFRWDKGVDRFIDIAQELLKQGVGNNFLFVMCGDMKITGKVNSNLSKFSENGGGFEEYVNKLGLQKMFLFLGYVKETYAVISEIDLLLKISREEYLGGRDIVESMYLEKPVLSLGHGDQFVVNGKTGILHKEYNAKTIANDLIMLSNNPSLVKKMGLLSKSRIEKICDAKVQSNKLLDIWKNHIIKY